MEQNEYFTVSFYEEAYRKDLGLMGSKSGRNMDKVAQTSLTPDFLEEGISYKEAKLTLVCRKVYYQDLEMSHIQNIPQNELDHYYKTEPIHRMYLGEVVDIID